MMNNSNKRT